MRARFLTGLLIIFWLGSCSSDDQEGRAVWDYYFDFTEAGTENWMPFFSDYPVGEEEFYELTFGFAPLPEPLDTTIMSVKISGNNHSDDLFSAIYRKFEGLPPGKTYEVNFEIELASNAPTNAVGIGSSPDLSLGAGGLGSAPANTVDADNYYRPNFESGLQSGLSNEVFQVLGTIGVSDMVPTPFMVIHRNNLDNPVEITSNSQGEIYLMIATDSGFEGTTTLYYTSVSVHIELKN